MSQAPRPEDASRPGEAHGLAGAEVVLTGRLASFDRAEARRRLEEAGATLAERPGERTTLLVVGHGGPPLGADGKPSRNLTRARALREAGAPLEIVPEEELLERLGLHEERDSLRRLHTTAQIARILEVLPRTVRSWVRHELIRPAKVVRRLAYFDFRQVATAKALSQLARDGVRPAQLRRSLEELSTWFPEARKGPGEVDALTQLEALEGGLLALRTEEGRLIEPSGQLRFDFGTSAAAAERPQPELDRRPGAVRSAGPRDADAWSAEEWFERGVIAEEQGHLGSARRSYERALAHGGPVAEYCFNLGNVLYALDQKPAAARQLAAATEVDPEFVEAWNNLGNVLGEIDMPREALSAYRRALAIEPDYADAHFNLAETLFALGEERDALAHWRAYLAQDPFSSWAQRARERLRRIEG